MDVGCPEQATLTASGRVAILEHMFVFSVQDPPGFPRKLVRLGRILLSSTRPEGRKVSSFDRDLFDEVVHYIAWQTRDDSRFGRVKLAKTLFYADFTAYEEDGQPLTGARYFHWPQGPFTAEIYDAERRLVERGVASLSEPAAEFDEAKLSAPTFVPMLTQAWHRAYLDIKIRKVQETGAARTISEKSHEHPGWLVTQMKHEIPYYSVYIGKPTQDDVRAAQETAREYGWI